MAIGKDKPPDKLVVDDPDAMRSGRTTTKRIAPETLEEVSIRWREKRPTPPPRLAKGSGPVGKRELNEDERPTRDYNFVPLSEREAKALVLFVETNVHRDARWRGTQLGDALETALRKLREVL